MADVEPSSRVTFLLGAGASVEAGCPTVVGLTESFRAYLSGYKSGRYVRAWDWVCTVLSESASTIPDVELVLATLRELDQKDRSLLAPFVTRRGWRSEVGRFRLHFPVLTALLEAHIKELCERGRETDYLQPMLDFAQDSPLDVFTLNYDYTIELAAQRRGMSIVDGFATYWSPALFDQVTGPGIRLHKIHGSLGWYETSSSPKRLVKIPVVTGGNNALRFFSDETVANLLIYPAIAKESHSEPYSTLLSRLRASLSTATDLVVVGYSFRDQYVKDILLEKMQENRTLRLTVIDPHAADVLERSDNTVESNWRFQHVRQRVRPLEETTGEAFAGGWLARGLRAVRDAELAARRARDAYQRGLAAEQEAALYEAIEGFWKARDYGALRLLFASAPDLPLQSALRKLTGRSPRGWVLVLLAVDGSRSSRARWAAEVLKEDLLPLTNGMLMTVSGTATSANGGPPYVERDWSDRADALAEADDEFTREVSAARWQLTPRLRSLAEELRLCLDSFHAYSEAMMRGADKSATFGGGRIPLVQVRYPGQAAEALGQRFGDPGQLRIARLLERYRLP